MKDYQEFLHFFEEDCWFEVQESLSKFSDEFVNTNFEEMGLSNEAVNFLQRSFATMLVKFSLKLLKSYHEWDHSFPDVPLQ